MVAVYRMGNPAGPIEHIDYAVKVHGRFTIPILTVTNTGLPNTMPEGRGPGGAGIRGRSACIRALERLCADILQPIEADKGELIISSAYRNPAVNQAVGGDPQSAHMEGRAADCTLKAGGSWFLFKELVKRRAVMPIDKVIYERRHGRGGDLTEWVHVQVSREGETPRRKCYLSLSPASYVMIEPGDARLAAERCP